MGMLSIPLFVVIFPLTVVLSHRHYRKEKQGDARFSDVLLISGLIIFLTYTLEFGISWTFFKGFIEETVVMKEEKGIFDLMNNFVQPKSPVYWPFMHLIVAPLTNTKYSFIAGDFFSLLNVLLTSPIICILFVLYFENVYLLFRKYNQRPWLAIIPFVNLWILVKIADRPAWWNVFLYVPVVRYFFLYSINRSIAADFRRTNLYALGMTLLPSIFYGPAAFQSIQPVRNDAIVSDADQR